MTCITCGDYIHKHDTFFPIEGAVSSTAVHVDCWKDYMREKQKRESASKA